MLCTRAAMAPTRLCLVFGPRDGGVGWGGYEGKKKVCVPEMGLSFFALPLFKISFSLEEKFSPV